MVISPRRRLVNECESTITVRRREERRDGAPSIVSRGPMPVVFTAGAGSRCRLLRAAFQVQRPEPRCPREFFPTNCWWTQTSHLRASTPRRVPNTRI